ncbi:Hachiman antiphage defense system protein HamA [Bacillus sp. AFS001701]|uniref:Hachiman antiphage defense system protein HamA n=1 Tax=Bacillus sp. AFS001701 TaxID=2033480 RepID=UPI0011459EE6|nr:Hachiman antiphage defense system protein HamA [Bacillus sp. AFS001701]
MKIKPDELENFLEKLPLHFRKCYITDEDLINSVNELSLHYSDLLKDYYLPNPGNVMSGEFGEILSYFILNEYYLPILLNGPRKWLWKDDRNQAVQKTDVMLFHKEDSPSKKDLLVSAEIKAKATKNKQYDPVYNAVEGAYDDYLRRLGVSLNWLKAKYVKARNLSEIKDLERFLDPVTYGEYTKHFKAIVVIDTELIEAELVRERELKEFNADFEIIFISINNLKSAYESTYEKILVSGSDIF